MNNHSDNISEKQRDFYQKLREKIRLWGLSEKGKSYAWSRWIMAAPDLFHLLVRLAADPGVPAAEKMKLAACIAYFIWPLDFIAEGLIGPPGYIDDVVLSAFVLNRLLNCVDSSIILEHWAGEDDVLDLIQKVIRKADDWLGAGLVRRLKKILR